MHSAFTLLQELNSPFHVLDLFLSDSGKADERTVLQSRLKLSEAADPFLLMKQGQGLRPMPGIFHDGDQFVRNALFNFFKFRDLSCFQVLFDFFGQPLPMPGISFNVPASAISSTSRVRSSRMREAFR